MDVKPVLQHPDTEEVEWSVGSSLAGGVAGGGDGVPWVEEAWTGFHGSWCRG